jgi:hypothetical protein
MKHLLSILLILTFSFQGYSQKKGKKKPIPKTKITAVKEGVPTIEINDENIMPDTLQI